MNNLYTFQEAQAAVYRRMRETDSRLLNGTEVKFWINEVYLQALKEKHYRFMDVTVNFNTTIDTTLAEDIATTDTDFDVNDGSGMLASGKVLIGQDVITYTGITLASPYDTLTGVTGIGSIHKSGAMVRRVYQLSELGITNMDKPIYLSLDGVPYNYYDARNGYDGNGYTLLPDENIILPYNSTQKIGVFRYKKLATKLVNNTDTFLLPDEYIGFVIEYATYKAKLDLGYDDTDKHYREYSRIFKKFKADMAEQTEQKIQRLKTVYQDDIYKGSSLADY